MTETGKAYTIPIDPLLQFPGLSESLKKSVREADINGDGELSVAEVLRIMEHEHRARADRNLFRNIVIALVIGMVITIAALCGTVYAIVDMNNQLKDDNNVITSKSSGQPMATATAKTVHDAGAFLSLSPEQMSSMEALLLQDPDGTSLIYRLSSILYSPGAGIALLETTGGDSFIGTPNGFTRLDNTTGMYTEEFVTSLVDQILNNSTNRRMLLNDPFSALLERDEVLRQAYTKLLVELSSCQQGKPTYNFAKCVQQFIAVMSGNTWRNFQQNLIRAGFEGTIGGILGAIVTIPDIVSNIIG